MPESSPDRRPILLDVRPEADFLAGHVEGAAHLELEGLAARSHELPADRDAELRVIDDASARAEAAAAWLRERGFAAARVALPAELAGRRLAAGPPRVRLWRPNATLAAYLPAMAALAPGAQALDLACGAGRDAVVVAEHGFRVGAIDVDPSALARARDLARRCGVGGRLTARQGDLERDSCALLGADPADLILVFRFLWRPLFGALAGALRPGGLLLYETFDVRERARGGHPRSPKHLLEPGELRALVSAAGLTVLASEEGVGRAGRFVQAVLARR